MNKPRLLYASPFPPMPSGISDYSVVLVQALSQAFDITLYIEDYIINEPTLKGYPVLRYGRDSIDFDSFDYRIYNMGNNVVFHSYIYEALLQHPGMVILHDYNLFDFFRGYYDNRRLMYSKLYQWGGMECLSKIKEAIKNGRLEQSSSLLSEQYPLNAELLTAGNKIMVHSEYARNKILNCDLIRPDRVKKINHIALLYDSVGPLPKHQLFTKLGIPEDAMVISSFGYVLAKKLVKETITAVTKLFQGSGKKICYVMVGGGNYADEKLEPGKIIKTGYTELDEFNSMIDYSDIVVNLRNPSHGETSGAMLRILQKGKPCITNNGGWFTEIPNECVQKISLDDIEGNIERAIRELVENDNQRKAMGEAAKRYVEQECGAETIRRQICDFLGVKTITGRAK